MKKIECLLEKWDGIDPLDYTKRRTMCECKECMDLRDRRKRRLEATKHEVIENDTVRIINIDESER